MVLENVVFCPTHFVSGPKQFDKECRYDVSGVRDSHGQCPVTSSDGKQLGTGTTEREREHSHPGKISPSSRQQRGQQQQHTVTDDSIES